MSKQNQKQKHQIIFIYRDKIFFCDTQNNSSQEFAMNQEIVKDLGIIDQAKLEALIRKFLNQQKANVAETLIILNKNTYFRTTIENPLSSPDEIKAKIDEFSDLVPFDDIFVKQFKFNKQIEIIAINREFYEPILSVLEKLDFKITMILPELVVEGSIGNASCTPEESSSLLHVIHKLGPYDLLGSKHKLITKENAKLAPIKEQNRRLTILVVTFAIMILVLFGAILFNSKRNSEDKKRVEQLNREIKAIEAAETEALKIELEEARQATLESELKKADSSSPAAALSLDSYRLRILNGSGVVGQAGIVRDKLIEIGFEDIDVGNAQKLASNKTQIIFKPTLPASIRKLILEVLESLNQDYSIQENNELNYDIIITTTAAK